MKMRTDNGSIHSEASVEGGGCCNLCGSKNVELLLQEKGNAWFSDLKNVFRCKACGLVYRPIGGASALKEQNIQKYEDHYFHRGGDWMAKRRLAFAKYWRMLDAFRTNNRILDVGAGEGLFISECQKNGWQTCGVEPSALCRDFAKEKLGIELLPGTLDTVNLQPSSFDVVTFWNVLDYVPDPLATLQQAYQLLRPGGLVLIRVPNATFHITLKRLFSQAAKWSGMLGKLERQSTLVLYSFTVKTLALALNQCGFVTIAARPAHMVWTTNRSGFWQSLTKDMLKLVIAGVVNSAFFCTRGRIMLAPSLLVTAVKPSC